MKPQQIRDILAQTLDDRHLSRGERSALHQVLADLSPGESQLANYRSIAFDLARDAIGAANAPLILNWLEDVLKLFQQASARDAPNVAAESFFSPGDDCPGRIRGLLAGARHSVDICVFAITDDRLSSAILEAHRRRLKVRIITDDDKAGDCGGDAERLVQAGIDLRMDRSIYHMHHKFALFDRSLLLTGSYNWTRGAADSNEENFIVTGDQRFIGPFSEVFENLWKKFA